MFYPCLATAVCITLGLLGLIVAVIDIDRFNFGLYLALLSVVGSTVSIAAWIVAPKACRDPAWIRRLLDRYVYQFTPIHNMRKRRFKKKRKKRSVKAAQNFEKSIRKSSKPPYRLAVSADGASYRNRIEDDTVSAYDVEADPVSGTDSCDRRHRRATARKRTDSSVSFSAIDHSTTAIEEEDEEEADDEEDVDEEIEDESVTGSPPQPINERTSLLAVFSGDTASFAHLAASDHEGVFFV